MNNKNTAYIIPSKGVSKLKKFFYITVFVLTSMFVFLIITNVIHFPKKFNKDEHQYTITEPYQFPVLPGSDKWLQLTSNSEKTQACQIPKDVLKKLSTEALIDTVLSYPLLPVMFTYSSEKEGYDALLKQFNGLNELSKRPDAVKKLADLEKSLTKYKDQTNELGLKELNIRWILKGINGKL